MNASGVWTTAHGRELAEGLAERMAAIRPRAEDDPEAELAGCAPDPSFCEISTFDCATESCGTAPRNCDDGCGEQDAVTLGSWVAPSSWTSFSLSGLNRSS